MPSIATIGVYGFDRDSFLAALLCVERDPEACHRSLIAARLQQEWGFDVAQLRPAEE